LNAFFQSLHVNEWLSLSGLFALTPPAYWYGEFSYEVFVIGSGVVAIVLLFVRAHRAILDRLSPLLWTNFILGLFLLFFRLQLVPLLGMDLFRTLQEIGFAIWLAVIVRHALVEYPKVLFAKKVAERKTKYHPKQKSS
jgi:hypothetical protein